MTLSNRNFGHLAEESDPGLPLGKLAWIFEDPIPGLIYAKSAPCRTVIPEYVAQ